MKIFLIKVNDLYYGKENTTNGRILNVATTDKDLLPYIVKEIGYKTEKGALKAAKKLQKEKKNAKISLQGLIFEN